MRMWLGVSPEEMCRNHLLGEHNEIHMALGSINKEKNINGFYDKYLIIPELIPQRHQKLADEMKSRGYNHVSPLELTESWKMATVMTSHLYHDLPKRFEIDTKNRQDLFSRCSKCKKRMLEYHRSN